MSVTCDYCGKPAWFISSGTISRIDFGMIWYCPDCRAWVGVHKGTDRPLGRLADTRLRRLKKAAHRALDGLLRGKEPSTKKAIYEWLAGEMSIPLDKCYISMLDADQCEQLIKICKGAKKHEG